MAQWSSLFIEAQGRMATGWGQGAWRCLRSQEREAHFHSFNFRQIAWISCKILFMENSTTNNGVVFKVEGGLHASWKLWKPWQLLDRGWLGGNNSCHSRNGARISEAPIYPGSQVSIDYSIKTPRIPIVDQWFPKEVSICWPVTYTGTIEGTVLDPIRTAVLKVERSCTSCKK